MCSTPRPKTKVKGKSGASGSLLSNMSPDARSSFAQRANAAQERRDQIARKARPMKEHRTPSQGKTRKVVDSTVKKTTRGFNW